MVKVKNDLKTYSVDTSIPKFNISNLSLAEIEQELEHLIFVEHEEDMASYTHLRPLIKEMAKLMVRQSDRAIVAFQNDMTYRLAKEFESSIGAMIFGQAIETRQKMRVDTTIDDIGVVGQVTVPRDTEVQQVKRKGGHNDW